MYCCRLCKKTHISQVIIQLYYLFAHVSTKLESHLSGKFNFHCFVRYVIIKTTPEQNAALSTEAGYVIVARLLEERPLKKQQFKYQRYILRIFGSVILLPIAFVILNYFSTVIKNHTIFSICTAVVLIGLLYCYFALSESLPLFIGVGEYWVEGSAVCIAYGRHIYRIINVYEIRGYTTTVITSKTAVLRIRYNGHRLKLHSSPISGPSDFGSSSLYHIFEAVKNTSPDLKPQQDMMGVEVAYFYRSSARKK